MSFVRLLDLVFRFLPNETLLRTVSVICPGMTMLCILSHGRRESLLYNSHKICENYVASPHLSVFNCKLSPSLDINSLFYIIT